LSKLTVSDEKIQRRWRVAIHSEISLTKKDEFQRWLQGENYFPENESFPAHMLLHLVMTAPANG
jgi:hypothetical protein